jgi:hypothetical protein
MLAWNPRSAAAAQPDQADQATSAS